MSESDGVVESVVRIKSIRILLRTIYARIFLTQIDDVSIGLVVKRCIQKWDRNEVKINFRKALFDSIKIINTVASEERNVAIGS